jgi:thiol-disulfide isomerase/thioredoxin
MRKITCTILVLIALVSISCSKKREYGAPDVDFNKIKKSSSEWWVYNSENIILSSDFIPLDDLANRITKDLFLQKLTSGDYIALKLKSADSTCYQLFKLDKQSDPAIRETVKAVAAVSYEQFKREGKIFPNFDLKDLNGVEYSSENTKDKIVVVKCWFIACPPCIEEFPILNALVEKYKNRNDIVFISLAFDHKKELEAFLLKQPFVYAIIPDQKQFEFNDLNVKEYPTHFVIDKEGIVRKVVNKADEMIDFLEKDMLKN